MKINNFTFDKKRYEEICGSSVYLEPAMFLVYLFRLNKQIENLKFNFVKKIIFFLFVPFYKITSIFLGISLPRKTKIGKGFLIFHYGGIAINENVIIGENCTIRQCVTIGNKKTFDDVPTLGNNVDIGAGAVLIGKIYVGDNVHIGANAVVLKDVPTNYIAVGNPAINKQKK